MNFPLNPIGAVEQSVWKNQTVDVLAIPFESPGIRFTVMDNIYKCGSENEALSISGRNKKTPTTMLAGIWGVAGLVWKGALGLVAVKQRDRVKPTTGYLLSSIGKKFKYL